jgi:hypothetical protein
MSAKKLYSNFQLSIMYELGMRGEKLTGNQNNKFSLQL